MNPELDEALVRDFPNLYRARHHDPNETCMARGFEFDDGWEPLVRALSVKLEALVIGTDACAEHVKEKWGRLRFVMSGVSRDDAERWRLIQEAERASATICEKCGASGRIRMFAAVRTLCDTCLERLAKANWRYRPRPR